MKLDKGITKSRHITRPRTVDHNRKLLLSTERDDIEADLKVPRIPNISVPIIETLNAYSMPTKSYHRPGFYHRYLAPSELQLESIVEYEAVDEDLEYIYHVNNDLRVSSNIMNQHLLEASIDVWEKDVGDGEIIPLDLAKNLLKEKKVNDHWEKPENASIADSAIENLYKYWTSRRGSLGRSLLRRFWNSEMVTDSNLKTVFKSRNENREKMRLRNSKKNDTESYEKMKNLQKQLETLKLIFKAINTREALKKYIIDARILAFEHERADKLGKSQEIPNIVLDAKVLETAKELRSSYKSVETTISAPPPIAPPKPAPAPVAEPIKRARPEPQKKSHLSFDVARACCLLITEGEKMNLWPLISNKSATSSESKQMPPQMHTNLERKLKLRGRVGRGGKKIYLDRYSYQKYDHGWGRYLGIKGIWYNAEGEISNENYEDEDNEDVNRLHKTLIQNFRNFMKMKKAQVAH